MKKWFLILAAACFLQAENTSAQTFNEWFRQNKTQKEYLAKQIAFLKLYSGYLKKGYNIARDGLGLINDLKKGEFDLHDVFYSSLKKVNPSIKGYSKVADAYANERLIKLLASRLIHTTLANRYLPPDFKQHISNTTTRLLDDVAMVTRQLEDIVSDGQIEASDDERLVSIDRLYSQSMQQLVFIRGFSAGVAAEMEQRKRESIENSSILRLHGIK